MDQNLNRLADTYRGRGYDVVTRPSPEQLPAFAKDFKVELVAHRGTEGVLVTVKRNRDELAADGNVPGYAEITAKQPGWRFDLAVLEGENANARDLKEAREFSIDDISESLEEAQELNEQGFARPAVLAAWAALEAAMRLRLRASGQEAGWGSAPRQMLKELYSAGSLSLDEFQQVETAAQLRNRIIHGFAASPKTVGSDSVVRFLSNVTRRLVSESQPALQTA